MPVKEVTIKNVVDAGHVLGPAQDRKRKTMLLHQCPDVFRIGGAVEIHRKQLKTLSHPSRVPLIEGDPIILTSFGSGGPKVEQHRLSAQRRKRSYLATEIGKRKIGCLDGRKQPRLSRGGQCFDLLWLSVSESASPRRRAEGLYARQLGAFFNPHPVVDRQIVERLHQAARPANRGAHRAVRRSQAKEDILAVLSLAASGSVVPYQFRR